MSIGVAHQRLATLLPMAVLAVLQGRGRSREGRPGLGVLLLPLLVLALYLTTSFYPLRDGGSLEAIMTVGALGLWLVLDRKLVGLAIASAVAVFATSVELALARSEHRHVWRIASPDPTINLSVANGGGLRAA